MAYTTTNQGFTQNTNDKSVGKTLETIIQERPVQDPLLFGGNRIDTTKSLLFANYTGRNAELFVYKGDVAWGDVLGQVPFKHAVAQAYGGQDAIQVDNLYEAAISIFPQKIDGHHVTKMIENPAKFNLQGYGTYVIRISDKTIVEVSQTDPIKDQQPNTFYFKMYADDSNFEWRVTISLDKQVVKSVSSLDLKDPEPQWVESEENENQDWPTKLIVVELAECFTSFLVKQSNIPLDVEGLQTTIVDGKRWAAFGPRRKMLLGQCWLGYLEQQQSNSLRATVKPSNTVLRVQSQQVKSPSIDFSYKN